MSQREHTPSGVIAETQFPDAIEVEPDLDNRNNDATESQEEYDGECRCATPEISQNHANQAVRDDNDNVTDSEAESPTTRRASVRVPSTMRDDSADASDLCSPSGKEAISIFNTIRDATQDDQNFALRKSADKIARIAHQIDDEKEEDDDDDGKLLTFAQYPIPNRHENEISMKDVELSRLPAVQQDLNVDDLTGVALSSTEEAKNEEVESKETSSSASMRKRKISRSIPDASTKSKAKNIVADKGALTPIEDEAGQYQEDTTNVDEAETDRIMAEPPST
jgi:hypothetical protein